MLEPKEENTGSVQKLSFSSKPEPHLQTGSGQNVPAPQHCRPCAGDDSELSAVGAAAPGRLRLDPTRGLGVPCSASL